MSTVCIYCTYCVFSQCVYTLLRPEWRALSTGLQRSGARRSGGVRGGNGGLGGALEGGLKAGEGSSVRGGVGPSPSKPSRGTLRTAFEDILNQNLNAWRFGVKEHFKNAKLI